ncbi:MAG: CotH kinase family protein [Anaerolineales bacterium]|nr:CotH kinase family protein [Anaerolineales bacterium]
MKLGRTSPASTIQNGIRILLFMGIFLLGLWLGENGWWRALQRQVQDPLSTLQLLLTDEQLPVLRLDIEFEDYNQILQQRADALATGAFIAPANSFYPATITVNDTAVSVELRLREGLAENLGEEEQWGLEVQVRDDEQLLDMGHFELIAPSQNNGLAQYAFVLALQREGLLISRYAFVHLFLNGQDRGIYAVQERFASELLLAQERPNGVLIQFDSDLIWRTVQQFEGDTSAAYNNPVVNLSTADLRYFGVEAFYDGSAEDNPLEQTQAETAVGLLRQLQTGETAASEVFDVAQYGRFLALSDLWGAVDGLSLINARYFYNPSSGRLEPIAYNSNPLADVHKRISLASTFDNMALQAAYVQAVREYTSAAYLDALTAELEPQLATFLSPLQQSNEAIDNLWEQLRFRQTILRESLNPAQPLLAFMGPQNKMEEGVLEIHLTNLTTLPLEIVRLEIGDEQLLEIRPLWLIEGSGADVVQQDGRFFLRPIDHSQTAVLHYTLLHIPLTALGETDFLQEPEIRIVTRLIGQPETETQTTVAQ